MKYKTPLKMTLHSTDDRTNDKKNIGRNIRAGKLIFNEPKFSCTLRKLYLKMKPLLASNYFILFMKLLSIAFKSSKFLKFSEKIFMSINFKRKV